MLQRMRKLKNIETYVGKSENVLKVNTAVIISSKNNIN